ncbi:MAG: hypothetical protein ACP5M9_00715 [Candidatus Micrarchaeia archaeon]
MVKKFAYNNLKFLFIFATLSLLGVSNATSFVLFHSLSASININTPLIFQGKNETITASVTGGYPPYNYEWLLNGQPVGRDSSLFMFQGNQSTNGYDNITLTVVDQYNNIIKISNYVYVQNPNFFSAYLMPSTISSDFGQNVSITSYVSSGTLPYTYHWNFIPNSGVQTTLPCSTSSCNFTATQNGDVQLTVIDSSGRVTSAISKVSVVGSPIFVTVAPYTITDPIDSQQVLYASATGGSGSFKYFWYNYTSGSPVLISGSNTNTLVLNLFTPGHFEYYVIAYDSKASSSNPAKSNLVYLTVGDVNASSSNNNNLSPVFERTLANPVCSSLNLSQGTSNTVSLYNNNFKISETLLTNYGADIDVDGNSYYTGVNKSINLGVVNNYSYSLELKSIFGVVNLESTVLLCVSEVKIIQENTVPIINSSSFTNGVPNVEIKIINGSNNSSVIYASTNFGFDKIEVFSNNNLMAIGIGNISYSTSLMKSGNYSLLACDVTTYPEQCSTPINLSVGQISKTTPSVSSVPFLNIKLPFPPIYLVGVIIVIIAVIFYKRRSNDYDYLYGSREGKNDYDSGDDEAIKKTSTTNTTKKMTESSSTDDSAIKVSKNPDQYKSSGFDNSNSESKFGWSSEPKE